MCRLVIGIFTSGEVCSEYVPTLLSALCEVAKSDPLLSGRSHGDGWGLAVVTGPELVIYRSGEAIWCDLAFGEVVKVLPSYLRFRVSPVYLLVHVRRRGSRQPSGCLFAHPYVYSCRSCAIVLIHNGSVDKRRLISELGLRAEIESYVTDSEVLGMLLCRYLDSAPDVVSAVRDFVTASLKYVKTALNLGILICGSITRVFAVHYVSDSARSCEERLRYYRLYQLRCSGGLVVVSSSLMEKGSWLGMFYEIQELSQGVHMYFIEDNSIKDLHWYL